MFQLLMSLMAIIIGFGLSSIENYLEHSEPLCITAGVKLSTDLAHGFGPW